MSEQGQERFRGARERRSDQEAASGGDGTPAGNDRPADTAQEPGALEHRRPAAVEPVAIQPQDEPGGDGAPMPDGDTPQLS
ncbi:MAG TPA: hypothetical protein VD931_18460 [Baekduia sp.]|nr:hypothetical protein [Baekduia sp.]